MRKTLNEEELERQKKAEKRRAKKKVGASKNLPGDFEECLSCS